nr:MAG TPA: hypothetical protein [Caudoviricetes sp.]
MYFIKDFNIWYITCYLLVKKHYSFLKNVNICRS